MIDPELFKLAMASAKSDPALRAALEASSITLDGESVDGPSAEETAPALLATIGLLYRSIRQTKVLGDLTLPESSALSHLRHGAATSARLAKLEHISPQSMGATIATLEEKGLITRAPDPGDGRRVILSLSPAGKDIVAAKRSYRARQFTAALEELTGPERALLLEAMPLLERIAEIMPTLMDAGSE